MKKRGGWDEEVMSKCALPREVKTSRKCTRKGGKVRNKGAEDRNRMMRRKER